MPARPAPAALAGALAASVVSAVLGGVPEARACGAETDCTLDSGRHYRIALPEGHADSEIGAIVFAHGYRGSAAAVMRNARLKAAASELGVALIAIKSAEEDWMIPGVPGDPSSSGEAELAYVEEVLGDAEARHRIDRNRLMATGFSAGGMMVWTLICHRSELFSGFAPIAGTFWRPEPARCDSPPADVLHIHGVSDRIVPLGGRPIGPTHQGSVPDVLEMYGRHGGYGPATAGELGIFECQNRENAEGRRLAFCTHPGGHALEARWLTWAWRHFEAAGRL